MPNVVVIAGPNGAGKPTVAPALLADLIGVAGFVNADVIARGLSGFAPERVAVQAGRLMLARLHELADQGADFAFETTLASRTFAPWIATLQSTGYFFRLLYVWVPDPTLSIARVAGRVSAGGHHVPSDVIRRRYYAGLRNFFALYRPIADFWRVYDNSRVGQAQLVPAGTAGSVSRIHAPQTWSLIRRMAEDDPGDQ